MEVRSDPEGRLNRRRENGRCVEIRTNQKARRINTAVLNRCRQDRERQRDGGNSLPRRRRDESGVPLGHTLAALLAMMAVGRAGHGMATIHRLFRRGHRVAIERVGREGDSQSHEQNCLPNSHRN